MSPLPQHPFWLLLRAGLRRAPRPGPLPQEEASWHAPALDGAHRAAFARALGFPADALPLSYHYLALQRAQLDWMLRPAFPHRLLGMVHVAQQLERLAPWSAERGFALHLRAETEGKRNLLLHARFEQNGVPVLAARSLYRPPRDKGSKPLRERAPEPPPAAPELARWDLPANAGRRYAWLSGDANPIHLWPWTARAFGLSSPIVHGMHTLARCEAALSRNGPVQRLRVEFLRPLALPGWAALHGPDDEGRFVVQGPAGRCAVVTV